MSRVCACPDKEKYCKEACPCCYEEMLEELQKFQGKVRSCRIMTRNLFEFGLGYWYAKLNLGEYERASGDAECEKCRLKFSEHPEIDGYPTFVVACDGRILKL